MRAEQKEVRRCGRGGGEGRPILQIFISEGEWTEQAHGGEGAFSPRKAHHQGSRNPALRREAQEAAGHWDPESMRESGLEGEIWEASVHSSKLKMRLPRGKKYVQCGEERANAAPLGNIW